MSLGEGGQQADTMPQAGPGLRHPLLQVVPSSFCPECVVCGINTAGVRALPLFDVVNNVYTPRYFQTLCIKASATWHI